MDIWMIVYNFSLLVSLIIGGFIGTYLAQVVFGRPKYSWSRFVEIIVYSIVLIGILLIAVPMKIDWMLVVIYFFIGVFASLLARGVSTGMGIMAVRLSEASRETRERTREERVIINVAKLLIGYGLSDDDVVNLLVSSGFKKNQVLNILRTHHFKRGSNPLVKRIIELESQIDELKKSRRL